MVDSSRFMTSRLRVRRVTYKNQSGPLSPSAELNRSHPLVPAPLFTTPSSTCTSLTVSFKSLISLLCLSLSPSFTYQGNVAGSSTCFKFPCLAGGVWPGQRFFRSYFPKRGLEFLIIIHLFIYFRRGWMDSGAGTTIQLINSLNNQQLL